MSLNFFLTCKKLNLIIKLMETTSPEYFNDLQPSVTSYEPPRIEILEITVEKGFADSTKDWNDGTW